LQILSLISIFLLPSVDVETTSAQALVPVPIAGGMDGGLPVMLTCTVCPPQVTSMEVTAGFALFASIPEEAACSKQSLVKSCFVHFAK
jgi:hypothetical protein